MRSGLIAGILVAVLIVLPSCRQGEQEKEEGQAKDTVVQEQPKAEPGSQPANGETEEDDPLAALGADAACYVCHMTFVNEELSVVHMKAKVGCTKCHGVSAGHANDENIGATKPDVVIRGEQINPYCRTCHEFHDVEPEKMIARWRERGSGLSATQPAQQAVTCTQCHGQHKISDE